jgi:chemotaxis signal transduction protein
VLQVHRLSEGEIEVAGAVLGGQLADYVVGIGRPPGALLTLIDLDPIIARTT